MSKYNYPARLWNWIVAIWKSPPQDVPWKILFRIRRQARKIMDLMGSTRIHDFMKLAFRSKDVSTEIQVQYGESYWEHKISKRIYY